MGDDQTISSNDPSGSEQPRKTRDARGRWLEGHCPNPKGRPKKRCFKDDNPSDLRQFMNTQIEVATADGPQMMTRQTALLNKMFEGAMKGKVTPMRMLMAETKESAQQMAELRDHFDRRLAELVFDNPNFRNFDESLTLQQKIELFGLATTLNHYYPGQYSAILGQIEGDVEGMSFDIALEKLRSARNREGRGS